MGLLWGGEALAALAWGGAVLFAKGAGKIGGVGKAGFLGDLGDGLGGAAQQQGGVTQAQIGEIGHGGDAADLGKHPFQMPP